MAMTIDEALEKLRDPTVTELDLTSCDFGEAEAKQIADALPHSQITLLDLELNNVGEAGAAALATALPHSQITSLYLFRNNIGDAGEEECNTKTEENATLAEALAQKLVTKIPLEHLDRIALQRLAPAVASYLSKNHELGESTIKSMLLGAAEQFLADGAPQTKAFALRVLPLPEARKWLKEHDIPLSLKDDFLTPEGVIPQGRFLCQGGLRALFLEEDLWETAAQANKALRRLPPEQKAFIPNAHTLLANLSKRVVVPAGPEVG